MEEENTPLAASTGQLVERAYKNACDHGFHTEGQTALELKLLIICEVAELVEADRKDNIADTWAFLNRTSVHPDFAERYEAYIKGSVEEEYADICIRLYDYIGWTKAGKLSSPIKNISFREETTEKAWGDVPFANFCIFLCRKFAEDLDPKIMLKIIYAYAYTHGVTDLYDHILWKMEYNETRPYKHGKKY